MYVLSSGVPGVGAAVQGVQVAAEQGFASAFAKVQVCLCFNTAKFLIISEFYSMLVISVHLRPRRSWQSSSRPHRTRRSSTSLRKTAFPTHRLSLGRKQEISRPIRREVARMQPEPIRAQPVASRRCLKATTILANSLVDTPGPTTRTPGTVALLWLLIKAGNKINTFGELCFQSTNFFNI